MAIETNTIEKLTGKKPLRAHNLIDRYSYVWKDKVSNYWDLGKFQ